MSVYMTEAEQLESIKKWWGRYGNLITVAISIVLLLVSAYKYWNWHQEKITQQASNSYEHLILAYSNHDNKSIRAYANELLTHYDQTVYADAARLTLAKLYVVHEQYKVALETLSKVAHQSKSSVFQQVAKIRLARLLAETKSYENALKELNQVDSAFYRPLVNELKGDIYAATGKLTEAEVSYKEAIREVGSQGLGNLFLEMKSNELASKIQSMRTDNTTPQMASL